MKVVIAPEIQEDATLVVAVGRINSILAGLVATAWQEVEADWSLAEGLKSQTLFLRLTMDGQAAGTRINLTELDNPAELKSKLRDVWGDLIQVKLDGLMVLLKARIREGVGS
jgi:hypothetical protein